VVVVKQDALDEHAVLAHCATAMAGFKVPLRAVFAEALPKNPSGKLLKRHLREAHAAVFANP
jgi:fatty-acyl-CoA synthase